MKIHYFKHPEGRWRPLWNEGPRHLERLEGFSAQRAWFLWRVRRWDTLSIATLLEVPEHQVFNTLRALREQERIQFGATLRAEGDRANFSTEPPVSVARSRPSREGR